MALSMEVVLTPTESKRLLAKALLARDDVKKALDQGLLMMHPSSTSMFMIEELGIKIHEDGVWVCGHINPKGLCKSRKTYLKRDLSLAQPARALAYPYDLAIKGGKQIPWEESTLGKLLEQATSNDVYIKSVNAIDPEGKVGVLLAGGPKSRGGSIGAVVQKQKDVKFKVLIPVGLEKRIPISIGEAISAAMRVTRAQGLPCGLWRLHGTVITEIDAFKQLFDVEAIPISAGGVCGAEGCIVFVLTGEEKNVERAYNQCEKIHGHELPYELDVFECEECPDKKCNLAGKKWPPK